MSSDREAPGTIADCDIILSISEEAINRQFELLYKTPINGPALPPPPGMEDDGVAAPQPSKYLINHDLEIHVSVEQADESLAIDYETGIFGHIKCPRVSFKECRSENKGRVEIEFQRDESVVDVDKKDSVFARWVGHGRSAKVKNMPISGWTMSWEVKLGQKNIDDIMKDLVDPAKSGTNSSCLHKKTADALQAVNNEVFTVSAIFCIFEAAQITDTFRLRDDKGADAPTAIFTSFLTSVSTYMASLQKNIPQGHATPDHPFVLGYGLSQKLPDIHDVQPGVDADSTPKFFIPKSYHVTVTPGSEFTAGTFNFCILTHRDEDGLPKRDPARIDPSRNLNVGRLESTFFDLTRTSEQDGIMAVSRDLMFDNFLCKEMASSFFIDVKDMFKKAMDKHGSSTETEASFTKGLKPDVSPPVWFQKQTERLDGKVNKTFIDDRQSVQGYSDFECSMSSILQERTGKIDKDMVRQAKIIFTSQVKQDYNYTDVGVFSDDELFAHVDMMYQYVLKVTPGKGGIIDIVKDDEASSTPSFGPDGKLKFINKIRPEGTCGAYYTTTRNRAYVLELLDKVLSVFPPFFRALLNFILSSVEESWSESIANIAVAEYQKKWNAGISSVKNRVILPAGNVFNFAGIDVDTKGNMYAHISFSRGTDGVVPGKDTNPRKPGDLDN